MAVILAITTLGSLLALAPPMPSSSTPLRPWIPAAGPNVVAVADFDADGHQDLATANDGDVTVLLGDGVGGAAPAPGSPFPAGAQLRSIVAADFDGDDDQDLATASHSGAVTVLLGDGIGGFTPAAGGPFTAGDTPWDILASDFDGDGHQDVATANLGSGDVTVLLGDGVGGFNAAAGSPFPAGDRPYGVATADFDVDGVADLATVNNYSGDVTVLLGDGVGGFAPVPGSPFPIGYGPQAVVVADFDGDGDHDLAITYSGRRGRPPG